MFEIKKELLETHEVLLNVEIDAKVVQDAMKKAARVIARSVLIPGFRKGKAPYSKVVRHVGEGAVLQEASDRILEDMYSKFIEEADVSPYGPGQVEDMKTDPLTFKIRVPLEPMVKLGDYKSLRKDWVEVEVGDEEVAMVVDQVRTEHAVLVPLSDRAVQIDDKVHADVMGILDSGDLFIEEEAFEFILEDGSDFIMLGFIDEIVGMKVEEEKSFTLTMPEDGVEPELKGAEIAFEVKIVEAFERTLPDADDALASTVGSFETFAELKADIQQRLLDAKTQQSQEDYREAMITMMIEQAEISYPPLFLKEMLDDMVASSAERIQREHNITLEDILRLQGRTMEDFRTEMQPNAEQRALRSLLLSTFAHDEKIEVSDDDLTKEYTSLIAAAGLENQAELGITVDSPLGQSLRSGLIGRKTMVRIEEIGRGLAISEESAPETVEESEDSADA